jgi:hypothetical protein
VNLQVTSSESAANQIVCGLASSIGKPSADLNNAQTTSPLFFLIPVTLTVSSLLWADRQTQIKALNIVKNNEDGFVVCIECSLVVKY